MYPKSCSGFVVSLLIYLALLVGLDRLYCWRRGHLVACFMTIPIKL